MVAGGEGEGLWGKAALRLLPDCIKAKKSCQGNIVKETRVSENRPEEKIFGKWPFSARPKKEGSGLGKESFQPAPVNHLRGGRRKSWVQVKGGGRLEEVDYETGCRRPPMTRARSLGKNTKKATWRRKTIVLARGPREHPKKARPPRRASRRTGVRRPPPVGGVA